MNVNRRDFLKILSSSAALAVVPARHWKFQKIAEKCRAGSGVLAVVLW